MSVRSWLAGVAGVATMAALGVVVAEPAVAAPLSTVTLEPGTSSVSPQLGALSRSRVGTVFRSGPVGGPYRSVLTRGGTATTDLGAVTGPDLFAGIQDEPSPDAAPTGVLAVPGPTGVVLTRLLWVTTEQVRLGTVPLAAGERYLGQAGTALLVAVPGTGGYQLVRRPLGGTDVVLAGGARHASYRTLESDAGGALLHVGGTTLAYLDHGTGALTVLTTATQVQGTVLDAGRVGWIDGATLSTAPRTAPGTVSTSTLPVATAQYVSGDALAWAQWDPATRLHHLTYRAANGATRVVAAFPKGPDGDWRRAADVVPDGTGWFGVHTGGLGGAVSVRSAGPEFVSALYTAPRAPATARALTISGGRVAYVDDHTAAGWPNSVQVLAEDGVARPGAGPVALDTTPARGRYGVTQAVAHGSRTVLIRGNGRAEVAVGGTRVPVAAPPAVPADADVVGTDGRWLVHRHGGAHHLADLRSGTVTAVPPSDVDGGYRWTVSGNAVVKVPLAGGAAVPVLPADPGCTVTGVESRQGDVLVRCSSGQGRVHGAAGGAPLLTVPAADTSTRLGSGLLWRVAGGMVTATDYRTPGSAPVVAMTTDGRPYAVDREGPWVAGVDATGRVRVTLVPGPGVPPVASRYVPVEPYRLLDTRTTGGAVAAGADRSVPVTGAPAGTTAVAVSVTVTGPTAASWLAVYPDGRYGGSSTVNFAAAATETTHAVVPVRDGRIALRVGAGTAHAVLDVVGFHLQVVPEPSGELATVAPYRLFDSRTGTPLVAGSPRTVAVTGLPAVPWAVALNVTVTQPAAAGSLSVGGGSGTPPTTVSFPAGRSTAAMTVVRPANGNLVLTLSGGGAGAHVLLDVTGYASNSGTIDDARQADYFASGPTRLLDTRTGSPVAAGTDRRVQVAGTAGVPRGAGAVLLTVVSTRSTTAGWLSAYPTGPWPGTSTVNFQTGVTTANAALVPLAADGSISLRTGAGTTHVVLDVAGYLLR
ncbi:MAG: Beta-galactosidase [uncultured Corynebacteriales bacterium]|uniref:Beta-galactosidase n=1 Tax=uncultured Mycobacteriales bacterium TaxID=581187 RepID=A0A6J4H9E3_9ACTN|nr:MAG: Beta-galactosidase [uncultured Corynebacteriales bacterium]